MINCEHVPGNCSVCGFAIFNKLYPTSLTKIVQLTNMQIISGTFQEMIVQGMSEEKSTMSQGLICAEILPL